MRRPPAIMYVRRERRRGLWLPVFLLWPIVLALVPVWLAVGLLCWAVGGTRHVLVVPWRAIALACCLPGLRVEVRRSGRIATVVAIW